MTKTDPRPTPAVLQAMERRRFIQQLGTGATVVAMGGLWTVAGSTAHAAERRTDGRLRVPPGQKVLTALRPMGGVRGDPSKSKYRLEVHGEVDKVLDLSFRDIVAMDQVTRAEDVHCVTGWTVLGARWTGIQVKTLAKLAGVRKSARHVIFEAAHGYTANVRLKEALADNVMIAHKIDGRPIATEHGAPVRAVVPDLYFWKSSKWLTGIRFVSRDEPGYWEVRGYNNHADPWLEERYA